MRACLQVRRKGCDLGVKAIWDVEVQHLLSLSSFVDETCSLRGNCATYLCDVLRCRRLVDSLKSHIVIWSDFPILADTKILYDG